MRALVQTLPLFLLGLQRVVAVRPPPGTLRRGLVPLPAAPTVVIAGLLVVALVAAAVLRRFRPRP